MSKKVVFIFARLIEDSEAYKGKTNADIENEILEEINPTSSSKITTMCLIPYVKQIEKVTVLDC